jgi:hypothetical protein
MRAYHRGSDVFPQESWWRPDLAKLQDSARNSALCGFSYLLEFSSRFSDFGGNHARG